MLVGIGLAVLAAIGYGLSSVMQALGARQATAASDGAGMTTTRAAPTLRSTLAARDDRRVRARRDHGRPRVRRRRGRRPDAAVVPVADDRRGQPHHHRGPRAAFLGIRLHARDWAAMVTVLVALCMLGTASHSHGTTHADLPFKLGLFVATIAIFTISLLVVRRLGHTGSVVAGMSAGLLFGAIAIAVRVLDGVAPFSITALLADRPPGRSPSRARSVSTCTPSRCSSARSTGRRRPWSSARPRCRASWASGSSATPPSPPRVARGTRFLARRLGAPSSSPCSGRRRQSGPPRRTRCTCPSCPRTVRHPPAHLLRTDDMTTAYEFSATSIDGEEVSLDQFRGKPLLIVNTASQCGFTPQ